MKNILLSTLILFSFIGCDSKSENKKVEIQEQYIEKQLPFTDLFNYRIKDNDWIRNSENILTVHETFKNSFYKKYLTTETLDQTPFLGGGLYYNISLRTKIDSLIITYSDHLNSPKYYQEFWTRRQKENNDSIVNLVLTEIQQIINGEKVEIREEYLNSTFQKLIDMWTDYENMSTEIALNHFEFFRTMGMNQSAYNLLYESMFYTELDLNRDSLKSLLKTEEIAFDKMKTRNVFLIDDTK
jgi:hypothetical protein